MFYKGLCTLLILLSLVGVAPGDFLAKQVLQDGEQLLWITYNGLTAKETSYIVPNSRDGLVLREVSNGHRFLQMIYSGEGTLLDCQDSKWTEEAQKFQEEVRGFQGNLTNHRGGLKDALEWLDIHKLRSDCRLNHKNQKRRLREYERHVNSNRSKRSIKDWFILPGTNWCGPHNRVARSHTSLGYFLDTDKCCRMHDRCRISILGLQRKYDLRNSRPYTLSHCRCDKRFRSCLKMASTGPANMVGKLFFNVVQTKCFVLKPKQVCTKQSWWGKCQKYSYKKVAHVKKNSIY